MRTLTLRPVQPEREDEMAPWSTPTLRRAPPPRLGLDQVLKPVATPTASLLIRTRSEIRWGPAGFCSKVSRTSRMSPRGQYPWQARLGTRREAACV